VGIGATAALIGLTWCASLGASTRWHPENWLAVGTVTALVIWLSIRTSPWVEGPIVMTTVLVIAGAPVVKSMDSFVSRRRLHWTTSVMEGVEAGALAVPLLFEDTYARGERWSARLGFGRVTVWGALLSIGTGLALTLFLAAGDPVFASFIGPPGVGNAPAHLLIGFLGSTGAAWLAVAAIQPAAVDPVAGPERTATAEATLVLMTITVVLAAFSVSQVATIARGRDFIVSRTNTTFAEYAREGFFQLLVAALFVIGVLLAARTMTGADRRQPEPIVTRLFVANAIFTVGLVLVAIRRLSLYEAEFGLTMLRLMATLAATWLGLATILIVVATVGSEWLRRRLPAALMASIVIGLIVLAALNPERIVVERNLDRFENGQELDLRYLGSLSPDGLLALRDGLEDLSPEATARLLPDDPADLKVLLRVENLCNVNPTSAGWAGWSLTRDAVGDWWRSICR